MESVYQFAFILVSSVGGAVAVIFALSSWLGKVWANRILESEKSKYSKELDSLRHQLQVEFNRLSIIHENQRVSFQRVIKALNKTIKTLEQAYDEDWHPIRECHYDELKRTIIEESLFLGKEGEHALNIFLKFFGRCISFPEGERQSDQMLRNLYEHLCFIDENIREYFRQRIGLSEEANPLKPVYLLATCLLINDYDYKRAKFLIDPIIKFKYDAPPLALVEKLDNNIDVLCQVLQRLIDLIETEAKSQNYHFEDRINARKYLQIIQSKALTPPTSV